MHRLWAIGLLSALVAVAGPGCGGRHATPLPQTGPGADARPLPSVYHLQVGDEVAIYILDQADLSGSVKVRPDGMISANGVGDVPAAGRTVPELTADLREAYGRILRYPDLSVVLRDYAALQVYVFGEVRGGGGVDYSPNMTALHALGAASGPTTRANLHNTLVLRRTGPESLDVYRVDLDDAIDGEATARDLFLQPYDIVFVPKSFIAEVNTFVDQWVRQNVVLLSAYIEGWRAFNLKDVKTVTVR